MVAQFRGIEGRSWSGVGTCFVCDASPGVSNSSLAVGSWKVKQNFQFRCICRWFERSHCACRKMSALYLRTAREENVHGQGRVRALARFG